MSLSDYRAKRVSSLATSLPDISGTASIEGITLPSPTGTWAAAGNGLGLSRHGRARPHLASRTDAFSSRGVNENSRADVYSWSNGFHIYDFTEGLH
jgi:hypothetical protein